ncbi:MAG: TIM barrel protein [bacterium]|jgi:sugar phosphate isomerase/epimerase|nr:TIM barrel protein [bacterium]
MAQACFHSSVEGAQHGAKGLEGFLDFAKKAGAAGAQPSNFMLDGKSVSEIKAAFDARGLKIDGVSMHCPFWVHTTAWTCSPSIRPFISSTLAKQSPAEIEQAMEKYILETMDKCVELGIKIIPMFWGVAFGWELASGYPWGFWAGGDFDLIKEGQERFITKTQRIRDHANQLGVYLAHEIHPGTGAMCADDFNMLVDICGGDKCLTVNVDPSHCWEGEDWETRFLKVADRCYGCHVKNHTVRKNLPLRAMEPNWPKRSMQFTDLPSGDINLVRFTELMIHVGYPQKYCQVMGTETAPLVVEAESAHRDLDATSAGGVKYVNECLIFPVASGSFEDGMGADD